MHVLIGYIITLVLAVYPALAADPEFPWDQSSRLSVLVLPFEHTGEGVEKAAMADDYLMEAIAGQKRFRIVERERLEKLLREQRLSVSGLTGAQRVTVGRLLSADQMLSGRIDESGKETVVTVKMVSTSTSATRSYSASGELSGMRDFRRLLSDLAARAAADFPLLHGKITGRAGGVYRSDMTGAGLRSGLEVVVHRPGGDVRHPETGRLLGRRVIRIATGVVGTRQGGVTSISIGRAEKGQQAKVGDLVSTK